jgi:hypothetical protein
VFSWLILCGGIPLVTETQPLVGILMGSKSDWDAMRQASDILT